MHWKLPLPESDPSLNFQLNDQPPSAEGMKRSRHVDSPS